MSKYHIPVLLQDCLKFLNVQKDKRYIDATLGGGGYALAIRERGGDVLGIDCDENAIQEALQRLQDARIETKQESKEVWRGEGIALVKGNFKDIDKIAESVGFEDVSGIVFDLGVSSYQLETPERGFSFQKDGPLDMRMDKNLKVTASDLVNGLSKKELYELFITMGQEYNAWSIVHSIIRARRIKPINRTSELANLIAEAVPGKFGFIHPATKVFQALRIAVNDELGNLREALLKSDRMVKKGKIIVVSFHSLEDRITKEYFKNLEKEKKGKMLTEKPITPSEAEIDLNPRSRSAKMRVFEKYSSL